MEIDKNRNALFYLILIWNVSVYGYIEDLVETQLREKNDLILKWSVLDFIDLMKIEYH